MVALTPDSDSRYSRQEARLWGSIGLALILGVIVVAGFAWTNDRLQFAFADPPILRPAPTLPDWPPIP